MAFKAPVPPRSCAQGSLYTGDVDRGVVLMDADGGTRVLRLVSGENRGPLAGRNAATSAAARRDARPSAGNPPNVNVPPPPSHQPGTVPAAASFGSHYSSSVWDEPPTSSAAPMGQTSCPPLVTSSRHPTSVTPSIWTEPTETQSQKAFPGLMSRILESGSHSSSKTRNNPQEVGMNNYDEKSSPNTAIALDTHDELQTPPKMSLSEEFRNVRIYPFDNYNTAFGEPYNAGEKITTVVKKEKDATTWSTQIKTEENDVLGNQEADRKASETFQNLCVICGARYRTKGGLHSHTIYKHSDARPFRCDLCGATFKVHSKLTRHKVEKHCDDRPYMCPVCGVSFKRKDKLGRHKRTLHSGDRPFVCRTCGKAFKRREVLRHHESKHYNGDRRPYECLECRKRFGRKDKINAHMRKEHGAKRSVNVELYSNEFSTPQASCS
ncbi:ZNF548 [Branchiostoma lanceolatum]|uniref:ZNF548 protein n=1 Tax=Branchiostoma lanceolatum TaxID=7740 RepID=A0A8J9ZFC0_BRALA|nr:ZNF548 [Branchiostoma lanceolatum]